MCSSDLVLRLYEKQDYNPWDIYHSDQAIHEVLIQLINGTLSPNETDLFIEIYESLLNRSGNDLSDPYFILKDLPSYHEAQARVAKAYLDTNGWNTKAILNTACSGKFSSDRTIHQYATEIWDLKSLTRKN